MSISSFYPSLSALNAFGTGLNRTAHNLANVNTDSFKAGRVNYADLANQAGVIAQSTQTNQQPGALKPYGPGLPPLENSSAPEGFVHASNTDIATEMLSLISTARAYQANARVISTADSMLGSVINILA